MSKEELTDDEEPVKRDFPSLRSSDTAFLSDLRQMQTEASVYKEILHSEMSRNSRFTSETILSIAFSKQIEHVRGFPCAESSARSIDRCDVGKLRR